jgi:uncharacterized membrane protein YbhN (UPF0104 family)
MKQVIRSVQVLSVGKTLGVVYGGLGFVVGCFIALFSLFGGLAQLAAERPGMGLFGMFLGAGAIILCPIFYGILGFLVGLLMSALYNLAARVTGGVEIELG